MQTDVYSPGDGRSDGTDILACHPADAPLLPWQNSCSVYVPGQEGWGPAQCKPTGTVPGEGDRMCLRGGGFAPGRNKHRASRPPSSFSGSCSMKQMLGSSGAGAHSGAVLPSPPPPRWLVYQERQWARQRELVPDVPGPLQQPVLDWPPSVLPAMWDNVFLITL